jgi:Kef-type K+ transport system membrane component KefB
MGFGTLAIIAAAGLIGPLLALRSGWNIPVVLGELIAGLVLGSSGFGALDADDPTFTFLADIGFALVMFVAGSHVPIRDPILRRGIRPALLRAIAIGVIAAALGAGLSTVFDTGHAALYAVLMASSSAALILPIVDSLRLTGPSVLQLLPQVAVADAACIVALPLVIDPANAGRAALGATAVIGCSVATFFLLRSFGKSGLRLRVHRISRTRKFAVELRISLSILSTLAAVAVTTHVSIMLAGFAFGLVVAAIGEPRRLAKQLFALTEGFLGPLFFIWLGASLNVRELAAQPSLVLLGLLLGLGALLAHAAMRVSGQPLAIGALACAQLGVPVAAATLATQLHLLVPGEAPALILGALVTVVVTVVAAGVAARGSAAEQPPPSQPITDEPPPATSPAG